MLKNSIKYYWEDPERIISVPLKILDDLIQIYPWSNVLRFLYWKRWLIEKTSSGDQNDPPTNVPSLYGELRYLLDHGPLEYDDTHFATFLDQYSKKEAESELEENLSSVTDTAPIPEIDIPETENFSEPEIEKTPIAPELPAEAISDQSSHEFDTIDSEDNLIDKRHQSVEPEKLEEENEMEEISSERESDSDEQVENENTLPEITKTELPSEQVSDLPVQIYKTETEEKFETVPDENDTSILPVFDESPYEDKEEIEDVSEDFEEELRELEKAFQADYDTVIQKLDMDIAKLNEMQQQEKYDDMLFRENMTEIDELIEGSPLQEGKVDLDKAQEKPKEVKSQKLPEHNTDLGKQATMRNLKFDDEVSGFTQWLMHFTKKETVEILSVEKDLSQKKVETSALALPVIDPPHHEIENTEFGKEFDAEQEDIWTSDEDEDSYEEMPLKKKKKKGKGKKKDKKKKKKKRKKEKKESKQNIDIGIVSEPLAKLFAAQGAIDEAISMYEKLILYRPEKKAKFAARIKKLKKTHEN